MSKQTHGAQFDFIIVGAGSAGCVVANLLSSKPGRRVLLIEAGRRERDILITMPAGFPFVSSSEKYLWGYESEPEPGLGGRRLPVPRGRMLGGTSAINAMAFVRGHPLDYAQWAGLAGPDWSWQQCLAAFKALETFSGGENEFRGGHGPMPVLAPRYSNPLNLVFLNAAVEAGYALSPDTNGIQPEGFGPMDQTIRDGNRITSANAFLDPIRHRPNLMIVTGKTVNRVIIEDGRATGVELVNADGSVELVNAANVVLSTGAINTPKLLMLSGVGPAQTLQTFGIGVKVDSSQVGRNLQDHVDVTVKQECRLPVSESKRLNLVGRLAVGVQWVLFKTGAGATNHCEVAGYIDVGRADTRPDIQLCFLPLLAQVDGAAVSGGHGYQATVFLLRPKSRGFVELKDANPASPPKISYNHLTEMEDVAVLREGLKAQRKLFAQPAFAPYAGREFTPGPDVVTDDEIERFMYSTAKSTNHPCSTCRMGLDGKSVTDPDGKVRGTANLWLADASVMPSITSGNINAPVMMLAHKIGQKILNSAYGV